MAKVFIGVGHGGSDPGAVKYLIEKDINLKMATACRDYLVNRGIEVKMSRTKDENDAISEEIKECNAFNPDLAVDVHNNAGGGDGFEVICSINGGVGGTLAKNIEAEVKKIGQNSRGIKTKKNSKGMDYFGFIRSIKCPSVICEGVFVDNKADAAQADTNKECIAFGEAYAKGILKTLGILNIDTATGTNTTVNNTVEGYLVKVTASALNVRSGAGTNYKIKTVIKRNEVYTIVEEKNGWGKLKSGVGWICLKYTTKI